MTSPLPGAPFDPILWDLDGTISDSAHIITTCLHETTVQLGHEAPPAEELRGFIGPPLPSIMATLTGATDPDDVDAAVAAYRALYVTRMYDTPHFAGVPELIRDLHSQGRTQALATSKKESLAIELVRHAGLADCFTVMHGASEDERRATKADVVADTVRDLRAAGVDTTRAVMIGDRHHDIHGAAEHGVPGIWVQWGYGERAEADAAIATAHDPEHLRALLG